MGCEVGKGGQAGARKRWERQLSLLVVSRTSTAKRGTIVDSATPTSRRFSRDRQGYAQMILKIRIGEGMIVLDVLEHACFYADV